MCRSTPSGSLAGALALTWLLIGSLGGPARGETSSRPLETRLTCARGDQRVLVLAPPAHRPGARLDVVVYFHGLRGYYRGDKKEDALVATRLAEVVRARGDVMVIMPEALAGDADRLRANQRCVNQPGGFEALLNAALALVPAEVGQLGLIAHSGGGAMIGPSLAPEGGRFANKVTEVTLLDAGYNYRKSWETARDWLIRDTRPKVVRVFTTGDAEASYALRFFATRRGPRPSDFAKALTAAGRTLTLEELASFTLDGLRFEVLELARAEHAEAVVLRVGSAQAKGHYPVRDTGLPAATRSLGRGPEGWDLSKP
jgi:hypothetical protein